MALINRIVARFLRRKNPSPLQYWEDRVRTYGARSVLNIAHANDNMDAVTRMQEREIFPHFRSQLNGTERVLLDFGCGPGRFAVQLAEMIRGMTIGVDPMRELLRKAPKSPNVSYRCVRNGDLPLPESSVDVIWCCLVMGGIAEPKKTVSELCRVLRPTGLIVLIENTSDKPNGEFWKYRTVEEYTALFDFVKLNHLHDYTDVGERISVMAGRKPVM
jgi:ubiquinone/menaquinone biosynthesis C-methylase UbiE